MLTSRINLICLRIFIIPLFVYPLCANSQFFENYNPGARSLAMSNSSVAFSDLWASFHNQAGLAGLEKISGGFYYESKYGIDYLSLVAGSVAIPVNRGVFGISIYQFGRGSFKANKSGLAFARILNEKLKAGIQLDYLSQLLPENMKYAVCFTFEGGIIYRPLRRLFLGIHLFNPVSKGFHLPHGELKMPLTIRAGGHYKFDEKLLMSFEAEKDNIDQTLFKTALEFCPADKFAIRFGASGEPFFYTAGIGYDMNKITTDIAFSYHGNLGITPSVSVELHF